MSLAYRIFLVDEVGKLVRIPLARWERLHEHGSTERLPEWAGKRVRYLTVVVELANRQPIAVKGAWAHRATFDVDGRLDEAVLKDSERLAIERLPSFPADPMHEDRVRFLDKRHRNEYEWEPSSELLAELVRVVLG